MARKLFCALLLLPVLLSSCAAVKVKVEETENRYETEYSEVAAETVKLSGIADADFEKRINEELRKQVDGSLVAFDSLAAENSSNVRMGNKCVLNIEWDEKYNRNGFLSLVEEEYVYTGGAHGSTTRVPKNIDIAGGEVVELKNLFTDDGYVTTLNRMINERVAENPDGYRELWGKPEIKAEHQTNFYLDDDKLVIFYQPYELSYYARGFVEFPLPLDELSGYLKEEYRRLID